MSNNTNIIVVEGIYIYTYIYIYKYIYIFILIIANKVFEEAKIETRHWA